MKFLTPIFKGIVENGKLVIGKKKLFSKYLLALEGKEVEIVVRKPGKQRSNQQNRYYRGVIVLMVAQEMGYYPDDAHEFLKNLFLKKGTDFRGKRYVVIRSTTDLSTLEFEDYLDKCRTWSGTELKLNIPLPNEIELGE